MIRKELMESGDTQSSDRLDQLIAQMVAETEALQPAERLVRSTMYGTGPKWLVEELYFIAIAEETTKSKYLKMAQQVLNLRFVLLMGLSVNVNKSILRGQTCTGARSLQAAGRAEPASSQVL